MKTNHTASFSLSQVLSVLVGFILFGLAIWTISQEFHKYHPREVWLRLSEIPTDHLLLAIALVGVNYIVLSAYDVLAGHYVRHSLPLQRTALVGFISYAVSNSIGFALLSGSAIRYHFYSRWGLSKTEIAQIIAFCNLSFWIGLFAVGGVLFLIEPLQVPSLLRLPFRSVHPIGAIFLAVIISYFLWNVLSQRRSLQIGRWRIPHLSWRLSLAQVIVTSFDWALAAGVLYLLMPSSNPLSYPGFFGIYLLAQLSGIISNVPGGLGVFETVMLLLLSPPVASADLLGALLAYRGIYYFFPLAIAVMTLGVYELRRRRQPERDPSP
jgi:uncharacterized membrane protein YbhN (UPF0104 family)